MEGTPAETEEQAIPYRSQNYVDIKKECFKNGVLFEDPEFPACDKSLFFSRKPPRPFIWKRPSEIVDDPKLFVSGASRFDIVQGMLGDCWLLSVVSTITQKKRIMFKVMPPDQTLQGSDYCGIIHVRFWQFGNWVDVVIDDRLPTYNNKLVFMHSTEDNEFWSAFLEKAYAKFAGGSYESLKGGQASEAMEDFTGGITERFRSSDLLQPKKFDSFSKLFGSIILACSIEAKPNEIEAKRDNGLIKGHAYAITACEKVTTRTGKEEELIRIRNPWGNEREWTGAWSDKSDDWKGLTDEECKRIGLSFEDDGEFWMSYKDFTATFTSVELCSIDPGFFIGKKYDFQICQGSWQKHLSAGGCRNFPDTFYLNPQYRIELSPTDEDPSDATLVVAVMQKGRRNLRKNGAQNLTIGFAIYKLDEDHKEYEEDGRLNKDFFLYHKSTARSHDFVNSREVVGKFQLPVGSYVIIPSTFKNNEEGDFIVRLNTGILSAREDKGSHGETKIDYEKKTIPTTRYEKFEAMFKKIAGVDGVVDAYELHGFVNALVRKELKQHDGTEEITEGTCKSLIGLVDKCDEDTADFDEFVELFDTLMSWLTEFKKFNKDGKGLLDVMEFRKALTVLGFKLTNPVLKKLILWYADKQGHVSFDGFVSAVLKVKALSDHYGKLKGVISLEEFLLIGIN